MAVQPFYETLNFNSSNCVCKQSKVECRLNSSGDISKILSVRGSASAISEEVVDTEVRYSARVAFYVLYADNEGNLKKTECGLEFTDKTDKCEGVKFIDCIRYSVTDIEADAQVIKGTLNAEIFYSVESLAESLIGGEDILTDTVEQNIKKVVGRSKSSLQVDGEFELSYPVKDILSHKVSVCVDECQSGVGEIILEGNVFFALTVLQNNEKNVIVKENRNIPFRLEMEFSECSPALLSLVRTEIGKCNFKVAVDEEKGKSTVIAGVDLDAFACIMEEQTVKFARDAYSPKNKVEVNIGNAFSRLSRSLAPFSERIIGATDCEIGSGEVVAVCNETIENLSFGENNSSILGVVSTCVIYLDENGALTSKKAELPFEIPFNGKEQAQYSLSVAMENFSFRVRAFVEVEAVMKFTVYESEGEEYSFVTALTVGEELNQNAKAISVYFAKGGDVLWDVCKHLGVSAEKIEEMNPDVQFPLSGNERIIVYRQV